MDTLADTHSGYVRLVGSIQAAKRGITRRAESTTNPE